MEYILGKWGKLGKLSLADFNIANELLILNRIVCLFSVPL